MWSGFAFADKLHFETRRDGKKYCFSLDKAELSSRESLSEYECNVSEEKSDLLPGTIVTLISSQRMGNPSPEAIKEELLLEFGYSDDFRICVNNKMLEQEDLPGEKYIIDDNILKSSAIIPRKFQIYWRSYQINHKTSYNNPSNLDCQILDNQLEK